MPQLNAPITATGAVVDLIVDITAPRRTTLDALSLPIPQPVSCRGLIDTGASCTVIDPAVLRRLALAPRGAAPVFTPSTGTTPTMVNQYDVTIVLAHAERNYVLEKAFPVMESMLAHYGFEVLIGRDVLNDCLFVYNGDAQTFTLAF